jgi:DGQHR domain-containing protein
MRRNEMEIPLMLVNQPIGSFYIGKVNASNIINNLKVERRDKDKGVQRRLVENRIDEILMYTNDPEATFPTPIIIAIDETRKENLKQIKNDFFTFDYYSDEIVGEILDGQHRIEGLKKSDKIDQFELLVVLMFGLTEEEKAYVFTTINSNQRSVPKSLIYDLFQLSEKRSPFKTCHEIARLLNSDESSPFYRRLKMLGSKKYDTECLSQGTFVNYLVDLISTDPKKDMIEIKNGLIISNELSLPFRNYFINEEDHIIYKIVLNMFSAVSEIFYEEWVNDKEYILLRTIGYGGIMRAFPEIFKECKKDKDFTKEKFLKIFSRLKNLLYKRDLNLRFSSFEASGRGVKSFTDLIIESIKM